MFGSEIDNSVCPSDKELTLYLPVTICGRSLVEEIKASGTHHNRQNTVYYTVEMQLPQNTPEPVKINASFVF